MPAYNPLQVRKGTATQWTSQNPILASGELGYDLTNKVLKAGDGSTSWNDLTNHNHSVVDISNFNSSVSGLLPITNIVAGTNIGISSSGSIYTISASGGGEGSMPTGTESYLAKFGTGGSGLVDSAIYDNGTNIGIGTNDPQTKLDISGNIKASGATINGNVGINTATPAYDLDVEGSGNFKNADDYGIIVTPSPNSSDGAHTISFNGNNIVASIEADEGDESLKITSNGALKLYGSALTFNDSAVGGGGETTIANSGDNRILTSTGSSEGINAEANLTFNGSLLSVTGSGIFSSNLLLSGQTASTIASFDSNKNIVSLSTATYPTLTELSYVKGVTSSVQTQLNGKAASSHTHTSSNITDFNSSVSGLLPTIANSGDNRILTSTGSTFGVNAEANATFDGTNLNVTGVFNLDNLRLDGNTLSSTSGNIIITPSGTGSVGIRTTTPSGSLHVAGTGLFSTASTAVAPNSLLHAYSSVSGDTIFNAEGTNGSLFSVIDSLSGSLMSVNNIAGLPVFEVFSDDSVVAGRYNQNDFAINSSGNIGIGAAANNSYKLQAVGNVNVSGTLFINGVSAKSKTIASFRASDNMPPATSYATLDTRNSILVLDFDDSATEYAVFSSVVPDAANMASGLLVTINWMATSATGSNCLWQAEFKDMDDDLDSITWGTAVTGVSAANATNGTPSVASLTLSSAQIDGLVAGDFFLLRVARVGGNAADTMTGDAELINVEVETVIV